MIPVLAGTSLAFEYTAYDGSVGLPVAMKIYDVTSGTPGFVTTLPMTHVINGTYVGHFTPSAGFQYLISKMVYTDGTYVTPNAGYSPGSETIQATTEQTDIQTLLSRLTAIRAGYLDNLPNLDATVSSRATQASVSAIQNNTSFVGIVPATLLIPSSGSTNYTFYASTFDSSGNPVDPDGQVLNLQIKDQSGIVIVPTTAMTRDGLGNYHFVYTALSTDPQRTLTVLFTYVYLSVPFTQYRSTIETTEVGITPDTLAAAIWGASAPAYDDAGSMGNLQNLLADIYTAAIGLRNDYTTVRAGKLDNLDATVSTRSTLTAAQVWSYATRTVAANALQPADIAAIWAYFTSSATVPGSIGKLVAQNLDAMISTRATQGQVLSALAGVAQESTLSSTTNSIQDTVNELTILIEALQTTANAIQGKTNNLPTSPVDTSVVNAGNTTTQNLINALTLLVNAIKAKTDPLPAAVASAGAVAAIPTNPLLTNDPRLNRLDANISSRATPVDLTGIARTSDVVNSENTVLSGLGFIAGSVADLPTESQMEALLVPIAKTTDVTTAEENILAALPSSEPAPTVDEIWDYATRTLTAIIQPDLTGIARTTDLAPLAMHQYINRMSTALNNTSGEQEIIAWAEKDGVAVVGSNCTVMVKNSAGTTIWSNTEASPNSDGVFEFTNLFTASADENFYVVISITVDGSPRINQQPFFTVG